MKTIQMPPAKSTPASYKSLNQKFKQQPQNIQKFFHRLPELMNERDYDVSVAYCFFRLEQAYNRTLYGGARKLHKAHREILSQVLDQQHLTRDGFLTFYEIIFGKSISHEMRAKIKFSEKIRDRIIHGKSVPEADSRKCLSDLLDFSTELDAKVQAEAAFSPFGDMRGITGQTTSLDKTTTRWVLKGMGFSVQ